MLEQTMVDDRERLSDGPTEGKNAIVRENLELSMPHNMEKEWRLYDGRGYLDQRYEDKKLLAAKKFDPDYVPCPWPVKKDPNRGWSVDNIKRCNHVIPLGGPALKRQGLAEIHCRMHLDFYFEYYGKMVDGEMGLPDTTKIYPPKWSSYQGDDPYATKREQARMAVERELAAKMQEEEEAERDMADEINRIQGEMADAKEALKKKIIDSAAVDGSALLEGEKPKRGRGRPKKEEE